MEAYLTIKHPILYEQTSGRTISELIKAGHDGVVRRRGSVDGSDTWIAFSPTQIKSATGNRGTFDPKNPKITESIADAFTAVGKAARTFWSVGLSIFFDMRPIVDAIENDADEDEIAELIKSILFPPPTKEEAQAIIDGSGIARRWKRTLAGEGMSFPKISNQVATGLSQGQNIQQIAKDIRPLVDNVYYRATRIARTESLRVVQELNRKASERTDDLIIGRRLHGTLDDRIRPEHRANVGPTGSRDFIAGKPSGAPLQSKQAFEVDQYGCPKTPYGTNCALPGQFVSGIFSAGLKAWYAGEVVHVTVASGRSFAVTINHPVLTADGFVAAGDIRKGQYLLHHKWDNDLVRRWRDNKQDSPAKIDKIFDAFSALPTLAMRTVEANAFDLHGDGQFVQGNIETIGADWKLLLDGNSGDGQGIGNSDLEFAHEKQFAVSSQCAAMANGIGVLHTAASFPCAGHLPHDGNTALLDRLPLQGLSFGPTANLHAGLLHSHGKYPTIDAGLVGYLLHGFASEVSLDKVIQVRNCDWSGHVYDLQTPVGFYCINGIAISNCRCYADDLLRGIDD